MIDRRVVNAKRENSFNTVRLVAAAAVLFSHSFPLTGSPLEPFLWVSHNKTSVGHVAVLVFFAISGYLITGSYCKRNSPVTFLSARALRIMPGLLAVVLITTLVIGPMVSAASIADYFGDKRTYGYVLRNLVFDTRYELVGVFRHNAYPKVVNGSLWTLRTEVICYIAVLVAGFAGLLRTPWASFMAAFAISNVLLFHPTSHVLEFQIAAPFCVGSFLYSARVTFDGRYAAMGLALCIVFLPTSFFDVVAAWFGTYATLYFASRKFAFVPDLGRHIDLSYGLYLWAFPVQQVFAWILPSHGNWAINVACSFPVTLLLAWASYVWVERPSLELQARLTGLASGWLAGSAFRDDLGRKLTA